MSKAAALWVAAVASAFAQNFELADLKGNSVPFSSLRGDVTVVMFISTKCPISNGYGDRINAVYKEYSTRGVKFAFVNANANESVAEIEEHSRSHGYEFPVYKDTTGAAAETFGATVTPEAFVIGWDGAVRYHGYVDDSLNEARIRNRGLRKALDAVLAGQPVARPETKAFGCTIKRKQRAS